MDDGRASYEGKPVFGSPENLLIGDERANEGGEIEIPENARFIAIGSPDSPDSLPTFDELMANPETAPSPEELADLQKMLRKQEGEKQIKRAPISKRAWRSQRRQKEKAGQRRAVAARQTAHFDAREWFSYLRPLVLEARPIIGQTKSGQPIYGRSTFTNAYDENGALR